MNTLLRIDGKTFRCECGANVFTKVSEERYCCNGCDALYATDPVVYCSYPECNCPFDHPGTEKWCARNLPIKENKS